MKTSCLTIVLLVSITVGRSEQNTPTHVIGERGPHYKTWHSVESTTNDFGQQTETNGTFVELATGISHWSGGEWKDSDPKITLLATGGAASTNALHKLFLPSDIYTGAIEVVSDGMHLRSRPLGLSFFDGTNSVLVAELAHSVGQLLGSGEEVIYTNIFGTQDVLADLLVKNQRSGVEVDLVFRSQVPGPEQYPGLAVGNGQVRLQLLSEFFDTAAPVAESAVVQNGLNDADLRFGPMKMVRGKAFLIDGQNEGEAIPVSKTWQKLRDDSGVFRDFLIEEVFYDDLQAQLGTLPEIAAVSTENPSKKVALRRATPRRSLPPPRMTAGSSVPMKLASAAPARKGFLWDWTLVSSDTNMTLKGDTTYYVSDTVNLSGTTTVEGGAVIKFTNQPTATLSMGTLVCQTAPYRPAILTSKDDDSVGETISGSTGIPTNYNGGTFIYSTTNNTYKYLRFAYAGTALQPDNSDSEIWHSQFVRCGTSIYSSTAQKNVNLRNVLFCLSPVAVSNGVVKAEHVTADQIITFSSVSGPILTNSILTAVTNVGGSPGLYNCATNASASGFYQAAGAGNYYLASESTNRNAGTTNLNATLLADLAKMTTYPPIVLSNTTVSVDTVLSPQAQRDNDGPDLGYHYESLDYLTCMYTFTNAAALTVSAGAAIACYNDTGILLVDGSSITAIGTPLVPIWFTRNSSVQEQAVALGTFNFLPSFGMPLNPYRYEYSGSNGVFRFCNFSCPAGGGYHLYHNGRWLYTDVLVQDCQFWSGLNEFSGNTNTVATVHNNLFRRSRFTAGTASSTVQNALSMSNNLFWGISSSLRVIQQTGSVWYAFNNAFDTCLLNANSTCTNGYNAYINSTNRINPTNAFDLVLTNAIGWQSGSLGDYYQPTNSSLINAGSTTADLAWLYHFTTLTNQVKETNSTVDIGFHYVATTNGVPIDTDLDGLPDYYEDANGNGTVNSGETDWQNAADLGLKVWITRPRSNSIIP